MTTITMNAMNTASRQAAPAFCSQIFADLRVALPLLDVASRVAMAAVPFAALAWMFIAC